MCRLLLLLLAGAASVASATSLRSYVPAAQQASSPNNVTPHVLNLTKRPTSSSSSRKKEANSAAHLRSLRSLVGLHAPPSSGDDDDGVGVEPLTNFESVEYLVQIEWAGQTVSMILDTGSSDSWLVQAGFQCVDQQQTDRAEEECDFGPVFNGTFTGGTIPNITFGIQYGDGEFLTGAFGYEDLDIAGISVMNQTVALVDYAFWYGDNTSSGLMGLAYPLLTSASGGNDTGFAQVVYDPIITTMIKRELLAAPVFSLALQRDSDAGFLALGGIPPLNITGEFASTPIVMIDVFNETNMITEYTFYTIIADAYIYEGSANTSATINSTAAWNKLFPTAAATTNTTQFPIVVDSGTTLLFLPTELFTDLLALFDPPATVVAGLGLALAPCNASVPALGVQIGGVVFDISPADMLLQSQVDPDTGNCLVGLQDGGAGPYVLGDTFMNNVVAVFDVGASEMRFAANEY